MFFMDRVKAILVQRESYRLELAHYIPLNPVRAGMVRKCKARPVDCFGVSYPMVSRAAKQKESHID